MYKFYSELNWTSQNWDYAIGNLLSKSITERDAFFHSVSGFLYKYQNPLFDFCQFSQQIEMEHVNWRMYVFHQHFIRHCRHIFSKLSLWKILIELRATEKTAFQKVLLVRFFVSVIGVIFWTQEDMTETSIAFLGKKNSENAVFDGSGFLALGGGSLDKKKRKVDSFWRRKFGPLFSFHNVWLWPAFYFNLFSLHFFWSGQVEAQIKAHTRVALFSVFMDNCL